ncbi:uncharacterized protein LOC132338999 [Haemorhous mexicanus]|uniref:uncharacterized protein LOC132338999 n=1 Tax=Haemorhous mexicanus TaxID=30427 RepID=UPI0028BE0164|nr:uncharacterized protein LOC132338999 [Haemorhous mexicanus]
MNIGLRSTGNSSNYNCEWLRGGSLPRNSPHLGYRGYGSGHWNPLSHKATKVTVVLEGHQDDGHQDPQKNEVTKATKATKTIMTTMVSLSTVTTVAIIATTATVATLASMTTVATLGIGTTMVCMAIVPTVTRDVTVPTVAPMVTVTTEASMATMVTKATKVTVATMVTVTRHPSWKNPSKSCPGREPCQGSRTSTEGLEQPRQHRTAWTAEIERHLGPLGHFPIEGFGSGNVTASC